MDCLGHRRFAAPGASRRLGEPGCSLPAALQISLPARLAAPVAMGQRTTTTDDDESVLAKELGLVCQRLFECRAVVRAAGRATRTLDIVVVSFRCGLMGLEAGAEPYVLRGSTRVGGSTAGEASRWMWVCG